MTAIPRSVTITPTVSPGRGDRRHFVAAHDRQAAADRRRNNDRDLGAGSNVTMPPGVVQTGSPIDSVFTLTLKLTSISVALRMAQSNRLTTDPQLNGLAYVPAVISWCFWLRPMDSTAFRSKALDVEQGFEQPFLKHVDEVAGDAAATETALGPCLCASCCAHARPPLAKCRQCPSGTKTHP